MEPKIINLEAMTVVGIEYIGNNEHREISELWHRFINRAQEIQHQTHTDIALGVFGEMSEDGAFSYLAGYQVEQIEEIPPGMTDKHLPAAQYAVFTHHGPLFDTAYDLNATYQYIFNDWLPHSGYQRAKSSAFERYDERFALGQEHSEMDIYIPLLSDRR